MPEDCVIWDKLENRLHRGLWTEEECLRWLDRCREIMPRSLDVDEVFEIRYITKKES